MTVDAILVCYCIDCEENEGNSSISHDLVKVLKRIEEQDGELIEISLKNGNDDSGVRMTLTN